MGHSHTDAPLANPLDWTVNSQSLVTFDANAVVYEDQVRALKRAGRLPHSLAAAAVVVCHAIEQCIIDDLASTCSRLSFVFSQTRFQVRFNMGPFKADMAAVAGEADVFNQKGYPWYVRWCINPPTGSTLHASPPAKQTDLSTPMHQPTGAASRASSPTARRRTSAGSSRACASPAWPRPWWAPLASSSTSCSASAP